MKSADEKLNVDTRAVVVISIAYAGVVGTSAHGSLVALLYSAILLASRSIHHPRWWREIFWLNVFLVALALSQFLSLRSLEGTWEFGLNPTGDRVWHALHVVCRGNAIFMFVATIARPLGSAGLVRGLDGWGMPARLVQLFALVGRYASLLGTQLTTVRRAVAARGFQWQVDQRSAVAVATATAMVLIRSIDRSERIERAMRARQFSLVPARMDQAKWNARSTFFVAWHISFLASLVALDRWMS